MDGWYQDLRFGVRRLVRRPTLTATAVLTLALGIGANTGAFALLEARLLRPLPLADPDRVVALWQTAPGNDRRWVAPANFVDWREAHAFSGMSAFMVTEANVESGDRPDRVRVASVSANFFEVLGVQPALGRKLSADDEGAVVIGDGLWRSRFGADREVLGRQLRVGGTPHTIVGVAPVGFAHPPGVEIWSRAASDVPNPGLPVADHTAVRDSRFLEVVARLAPGTTLEAAREEMRALAERLEREYPAANADTGVNLVPIRDQLRGRDRQTLSLLCAAVGVVLLIACGNVTNLLLADGVTRRGEHAVRRALGAGRRRLARQLLLESGVLALVGGGIGALLSVWLTPVLAALLPGADPAAASTRPWVVFAATLGASGLATLLCGVVPALHGSGPDPATLRGARSEAGGAGAGGLRMRSALVVAEVALAVALVIGSGLLVRTMLNLQRLDSGYTAQGVLSARVSAPGSGGERAARLNRHLYDRIVGRVAELPGVEEVALTVALPLGGRSPSANVRVEGRRFPPGEAPDVSWRAVSPRYFEALRIPLLQGRAFDAGDAAGAPAVTVVNRTLADLLWPGESALGRRIGTGLDGETELATVVGVVGDTPQDGPGERIHPEMFRPLAQETRYNPTSLRLVLRRAAGDDGPTAATLSAAIWEVEPSAPVTEIASLAEQSRRATAQPRNLGGLLSTFGALAMGLACVGLYGVISNVAGARRREIGVRLALGASPASVLRRITTRGLALAGAGAGAGVLAALAATRYLEPLLFGVGTVDPTTYGGVALGALAIAAVACTVPARRAARIDPAVVLREE